MPTIAPLVAAGGPPVMPLAPPAAGEDAPDFAALLGGTGKAAATGGKPLPHPDGGGDATLPSARPRRNRSGRPDRRSSGVSATVVGPEREVCAASGGSARADRGEDEDLRKTIGQAATPPIGFGPVPLTPGVPGMIWRTTTQFRPARALPAIGDASGSAPQRAEERARQPAPPPTEQSEPPLAPATHTAPSDPSSGARPNAGAGPAAAAPPPGRPAAPTTASATPRAEAPARPPAVPARIETGPAAGREATAPGAAPTPPLLDTAARLVRRAAAQPRAVVLAPPSHAAPLDAAPIAPPVMTGEGATVARVSEAVGREVDPARHVLPALAIDRIERLRDEVDAASTKVRVHPDALGSIDVSVRREGDATDVRLTAEQPRARELLAQATPRLAELAEQHGVRLGRAEVDGGSGAGAERHRPSPHQPAPPRTAPSPALRRTRSDDHRIA